jgi:nicotinamide mononucleotide transporter
MELYACFQYVQQHYLEILGTLTGLIYVIYSIERNRILWLYGGVSSLFYIIVFYQAGLLAYMTLYFYYTGISIFGWYSWTAKQKENTQNKSGMTRLNLRSWVIVSIICLLLFLILWGVLRFISSADILWADALLTSGSIVATWLLMRKVIDHWLLWIVIDILSGMVSVYKELPFAAILFFIYTLLAIKGYFEWKKDLKSTIHP